MATIVTRAGKGSPLTNTEVDSNFSNLNTDKAELSGSTFSGAVEITNVDGLVAPRVYVGEGKSSGTRIQLSRSGTTNKLFSFTSSTSATPLDIVVGATTNALSIDASANVSIPNGNLDVTGSVTSTGLTVDGAGSIGLVATDRLYMATSDGLGIQLDKDNNRIVPVGADGSAYNNNVSLGASGLEFKNLFLSGSVTSTGLTVNTSATGGFKVEDRGSSGTKITSYQGTNNSNVRQLDLNAYKVAIRTGEVTGTAVTDRMLVSNNGDISFYDSAGSSQNFYWDSSTSRLGLGVTNPNYALDVDTVGHNSTGELLLTGGNSASNDYTQTSLLRLRATSINPNQPLHNDNSSVAEIRFNHQNLAGNASSGNISFYTNPSNNINGSLVERLTINADGSSVFSGTVSATTLNVGATAQTVGSASSPAFTLGDTDTGFYRDGYNRVQISAAGQEVAKFDSSGNVNIPNGGLMVGSTTAPSSRFHLKSASRGSVALRVTDSDTTNDILRSGSQPDGDGFLQLRTVGGAGNVLFDASGDSYVNGGNFGIGCTPVTLKSSTTLQVSGNAKLGDDNGRGLLSLGDINSTGANVGIWRGAAGAYAGVGNYLNLGGYDGITFTTGASEIASQTERLRINADGSSVFSGAVTSTGLTVNGSIAGRGLVVSTGNETVTDNLVIFNSQHSSGRIAFQTGGNEAARITSGGQFLINATTPYRDLLVGFTSTDTNTLSTASGLGNNSNVGNGLMINNTSTADNTYAPLDFKCGTNNVWGRIAYKATDMNDEFGQFEFITVDDGQYINALTVGSSGNGTFAGSCTATSFPTSSDKRLKDNIVDSPTASKDIDAIQVRSFDWKVDGKHQKYGMVAQELLEVAPDAVTKGDTPDDMMGVDYSKLVPMLIKEIQSLRQRVAQLEE